MAIILPLEQEESLVGQGHQRPRDFRRMGDDVMVIVMVKGPLVKERALDLLENSGKGKDSERVNIGK